MNERYCRTCSSKSLPDVVEPCKSCVEKSNWNKRNSNNSSKPNIYRNCAYPVMAHERLGFLSSCK